MQRKPLRKSLELILTLLDPDQFEAITLNDPIWIEENLETIEKLILVQGVGPYLFISGSKESSANTSLYGWLEKLYAANLSRIERMHSELHDVLLQASRIGIAVMPLKGSLLTTRYYPPGIRPMADIDLLVEPVQFPRLRTVLEELGYQLIKSKTFYSNNYTFLKQENKQVVARDTEHPDNPRPIEVHTQLLMHMLGRSGEIDLTEIMWKDSFQIDIFNQKAISPTLEALYTHLALHAAGHLFTQTGRIMQLLDLALISDNVNAKLIFEYADRIFVPLKLASRLFPSRLSLEDFSPLKDLVDPRIKNWSSRVPIDDRCGLMTNIQGPERRRVQQMINRWKPLPWRLIFTYGSIPLTRAYIKYLLSFLGRSHRLFERNLPKG
jgi:hypothetical protein